MNKGDDENPEIRARLVAKETNKGYMEDIFAATPPLEALKFTDILIQTVRSASFTDPCEELLKFAPPRTLIGGLL